MIELGLADPVLRGVFEPGKWFGEGDGRPALAFDGRAEKTEQ